MNEIEEWINQISAVPASSLSSTPTPQAESNHNDNESFITETINLTDQDVEDILADNQFSSVVENTEDNTATELFEETSEEESTEAQTTDAPMEEPVSEANSELIPENSPSLLVEEATSRFSGAEWFDALQQVCVTIAGLGGIGSHTAFQIARMAPYAMYLYDDDIVEEGNMSGQMYGRDNVGGFKTQAMYQILKQFTSCPYIRVYSTKFTYDSPPTDIMICGFDNMAARREYFNAWKRRVNEAVDKSKCLYIDGRLSFDTLQVLCIQGTDSYNMQRYEEEFLFSDSEADATICSMKQTTYLACMIASIISNLFINFVANSTKPALPYDLPFFTQYDAQNMIFKTEY